MPAGGEPSASGRRHAYVETTLGELLTVADGDALAGLYFPEHWYPPKASELGLLVTEVDDPVIGLAAAELREYLAGGRRSFTVAAQTSGSEFSQQVWGLLREISYGETTTYGALAQQLGNPYLAQRVGQVVGRNPVSIVIPCHRVVGSDGSLTGFAGGLDRKRALLDLEEPEERRAERLF